MNKNHIRPAALALLVGAALLGSQGALAQNRVSVYGLIDMSIGRNQAPGGAATKDVDSGKMTTSYVGFKGSEDLASGLTANFAIESFLRGDEGAAGRFNGDPFWARSAWVGLGGGFGSVSLGRQTTSLFVNTLIFNSFGDSFGYSPSIRHYFTTSGTVSGDTGWSDSIKYASPKFGGASFTAHAAEDGGSGGRNYGLSGLYFGGPLALGMAWQNVKKGAAVDDTKTWQLGASYDFKAVKLFGQYGKVDNDSTGNDYKISGLGLSAPLGAGKALFQWGQISPKTGAKRRTISLGYDYNLSKRTDVYAVYMNDRITGLKTGSNYGLGIRHSF